MNTKKYLRRIGLTDKEKATTLKNLRLLQKQNLLNIPFENLDIHWNRPILLDNEKFYQKVVERGRGGFCYELNGLFYQFLEKLGYKSKLISARVAKGRGKFGAEYDHMAILTKIRGKEYLVDVGFGDFIAEPLNFVLDIEQKDKSGIYRITKHDDEYFQVAKKDGEKWKSAYVFKDLERDLSEFRWKCDYHQTSADSHFTQGKVCSLMTETGRKTLTDKKFIQTTKGTRTESEVFSDKEFEEILKREFNISK